MHSISETAQSSKGRIWTGTILSGIAVLFLLFDSVGKLLKVAPVVDGSSQLGYPETVVQPIGLILLTCVAAYVIPRTSILGAVLLTGYMGGAIASHLRVGSPLLTHQLFPVYVAVLFWCGLFLRDERLRAVLRQFVYGAPPQEPERTSTVSLSEEARAGTL
jgi:DoxX-like family